MTPTLVMMGYVCSVLSPSLMAQVPPDVSDGRQKVSAPAKEELSEAPDKVDINPVARDEEISKRLQLVLNATGWFTDPQVHVEEGVVFLSGRADSEELKRWA
ncbi:MAG: BON domain-containing protein, partial [Pirellulaceae bacterium]